jgi:hypothetical protein
MRAHTVTLVDTTAWLFGGCDDKECSKDIFCFDTGTFFIPPWYSPKQMVLLPATNRKGVERTFALEQGISNLE